MRWMHSDKYMILKSGLFMDIEIQDIGLLRWNLATPDMVRMRETIYRARVTRFNRLVNEAIAGGVRNRDDAEEIAYNKLSVWCRDNGKNMTIAQFLEFYKIVKAGGR